MVPDKNGMNSDTVPTGLKRLGLGFVKQRFSTDILKKYPSNKPYGIQEVFEVFKVFA